MNSFKYHKINSFLEIDKNSKFAKSRIMNYENLMKRKLKTKLIMKIMIILQIRLNKVKQLMVTVKQTI